MGWIGVYVVAGIFFAASFAYFFLALSGAGTHDVSLAWVLTMSGTLGTLVATSLRDQERRINQLEKQLNEKK